MLGSKNARAGYITAILTDPQHPFIWEFFCTGTRTVPRPGHDCGYYNEVFLSNLKPTDHPTEFLNRNERVHSSLYPFFGHSRSTSPVMGYKPRYLLPTPVKVSARLVCLLLQPPQWNEGIICILLETISPMAVTFPLQSGSA